MKKNPALRNNIRVTRKSLYLAIAAASQLMLSAQVLAGPEGGQVVGGQGSIDQSGVNTTIHQQTDRMAIDWQSFNVNSDEKVQFIQPSSSSVALNRVLSHSGSEIHGQIEANGHIVLVNPNGVFFGESSQINVGGIIASGLAIDPNDFMNGEFTLTSLEGTEGKVINSGIINAATGGSVTLVGQQVQNDGLIAAKLGAVNLAAGKEAVVTFDASGLIGVRVSKEVLQDELGVDAAVINNGEITAEGGRILLSASTSQDIFSQAVNHGEMNTATSVAVHEDGSFTLGGGADVVNTGNLDVSSTSGHAGQVVVVGENITTSGSIAANSATTNAGNIELHSVDTTRVTESAQITAQANGSGNGGDIKILGDKVGLFDNAEVNASGANGGGEILIGGDESGTNSRIRNADFIYLGEATSVKTDALSNGDGGKLITFAKDTARIHGGLSAQGGELGGNGGFIETSGLRGFELTSMPDISAVAGKGGTWLIDPYDIVIGLSPDNRISDGLEGSDRVFESSSIASVVNTTTLATVLSNTGDGGKVIIRTTGGALDGGAGDITIESTITYSIAGSETATLRLEAHNAIVLNTNQYITRADGGDGSLNVELIANLDNDNTNGGNITFNPGSYINTRGGYFEASGLNFTLPIADAATINTGRNLTESRNTPGGNVTLNMTGAVSLRSRIRTDGGNFTVSNSASFNNDFDNGLIDTSNDLGGGDIVINSDGDVTLGSVDFSYRYQEAFEGTTNLQRVGSVTIDSGGNVTLAREFNFNDTGKRQDDGANGYTSTLLDGQDTSLNITADGNIAINAIVRDADYGDGRDSLNINLIADGNIDINAAIYTAGGNFSASGLAFDSEGFSINADKANERDGDRGEATWSSGGDVTIRASSTIKLGGITTDKECTSPTAAACTGDLVITGRDTDLVTEGNQPDNPIVTQLAGSILDVKGSSKFNVGTGNITLNNNNIFTDFLQFNSAGNVVIRDTTAVNLGVSLISGSFNVNSGGAITQSSAITVGTTTTLNAGAEPITLALNNDFGGAVTIGSSGALTLNDINSLTLTAPVTTGGENITLTAVGNLQTGALNTSGAQGENAGTISLISTAGTLTTGALTANSGTPDNSSGFSGGLIDLAALGNITLGNISATGGNASTNSGMRAGGAGGNVRVISNEGIISAAAVTTTGGNAGGSTNNGGNAGRIEFTAGTINLGGNLSTTGGQRTGTQDSHGTSGAVTLTGNTTIAANTTIDAGGNGTQGNITFTGTLNSLSSTPRNLTLTGNTISFGGDVDDDIGGVNRLGVLTMTSLTGLNFPTRDFFVTSFNSTSPGFRANLIDAAGRNNTGGGAVSVTTNPAGNVAINSINTQGGTATAGAGRAGGAINIVGNNIQLGLINSSGSNTFDSLLDGGSAGTVTVTASGTSPVITLTGDILTQGGTGATAGTSTTSQFILNSAGTINLNHTNFFTSAIALAGSDGADTLNALDTASTWETASITGGTIAAPVVTGQPATGTITFNNFEILQGGDAADTFNIRHALTNSLSVNGGNGGDFYNLYSSTAANLNGGNDSDTFQIRLGTDTQAVINGGDGLNDTLIGFDRLNQWVLQANASSATPSTLNAVYSPEPNPTPGVRFYGIEGVTGGSSVDSFTIIGNYTGSASGGLGPNDSNDIVNVTGNLEISLANVGQAFGNVTEVEVLGSAMAGGGMLTANSITGSDVTWDIFDFDGPTGPAGLSNNGTITFGPTDNRQTIKFINFSSLTGGAGDDTFAMAGNSLITGVITGNGGFDRVDVSASTAAYSFDLGNGSANRPGIINLNLMDIDRVVGNSHANTEVYVAGGTNTWNILDLDVADVSDGENDGTVESSGLGRVEFLSVANLVGGSGNDRFTFANTGRLTGSIDGGGASAGNTITGRNLPTTWDLAAATATSEGDTYLNGFTNIGNLQGGSAVDTFTVTTAFSGVLRGGGESDQFTFTAEGSATDIDGESGDNDRLSGRNALNTWNIANRTLALTEGGTYVRYTNIDVLQGNANIDTFLINAAFTGDIYGGGNNDDFTINNAVTGNLYGELGNDLFKFTSVGNAGRVNTIVGGGGNDLLLGRHANNRWTMTAGNTGRLDAVTGDGAVNYVGSFTDMRVLTGGSATDTLVGFNQQNTWNIAGVNEGSFGATASPTAHSSFTDMENITGGTAVDNFVFAALASNITGMIDGGSSLDNSGVVDTLNLRALTSTNGAKVRLGADNDATTINVINIESITAASVADGIASVNSNHLMGASDVAYSWVIDGVNTGRVSPRDNDTSEARTQFFNFGNLRGGDNEDSFQIGPSGSVSGLIDGGGGRDFADYSQRTDAVSITLAGDGALGDSGIAGIEGIIGNAINSTLIGNNERTIWDLAINAAGDEGSVNDLIFFRGFTHLVGGNGDDILNAAIATGAKGQIDFAGGGGANQVNISGGGAGYAVSHSGAVSAGGQITYDDGATNLYSINYSGVRSIADGATAASLTVNNTATNDRYVLTGNSYSLNDFGTISYTNKESLVLAAANNDTIFIADLVNIPQTDLTLQNASVSAAPGSSITARGLNLDGTASVGSLTERLVMNVDNLYVNQVQGDVYLRELNSVNIAELSSSNGFDLLLSGNLTSSLGLSFAGAFNAATDSGSITLDKENRLSGPITLAANGTVTLANGIATNLASVQAQTLNVTSTGAISGSGAIAVNGLASFASNEDINLTNAANNFGSVAVGSGVNVAIRDTGLLTLANITASGNVEAVAERLAVTGAVNASNLNLTATQGEATLGNNISAPNAITVSAQGITVAGNLSAAAINLNGQEGRVALNGALDTTTGEVVVVGRGITQNSLINSDSGVSITSTENISQTANITSGTRVQMSAAGDITMNTNSAITAVGNVDLNAAGATHNIGQITSTAGAINFVGAGSSTLAGTLSGYSGINIQAANGNLQQQGQLNAEQGDIVLAAAGDITMATTARAQTTAGNIFYTGNNLEIAGFNAGAGSVQLTATGGAITDTTLADKDFVNVTAQRFVADAESGIGTNDVIKTAVSELSVSNNLGNIWLQNSAELTVDRLRTNGNIQLSNQVGNITLDNTNGELFSLAETDARLAGGTMNANYEIGTLTISVEAGSLLATGSTNIKNPDIVANNANLITAGDIGAPGRPLVVYVKNRAFVAGLRSWGPFWGFDLPPADYENASSIQGNLSDLLSAGNEQLVEVETLEEVDPAIFTSVRNYFYDDISILMPQDQLYSEDDDEE